MHQLKAAQNLVNAFDFLAIRLFGDKKNALWQVLSDINRFSIHDTKITDIKDTTDEGIAAKVHCKEGIHIFIEELSSRLNSHNKLKDMLCDTNGYMVKIYPMENEPNLLNSNQKFAGRLVISPDITKIKEFKLNQSASHDYEYQALRSCLWENMQENFRVFDAEDLWKNLKNESLRLQAFAGTNPTDFIAKKNNAATHTLYYWTKTKMVEDQGSMQKYCFAEIGVRIVRMVTAETVAFYHLTSEEEFRRGVMVTRDENTARRTAINELAKRAITKIITRLQLEKNFEVFQPRVSIVADNFETQDIEKLKNVILEIKREGKINLAEEIQSGESFARVEVTFPESNKLSQSAFRQILSEYAEAEGLMIFIQSDIGKLYITPQQED